jgi:hypothetical protein
VGGDIEKASNEAFKDKPKINNEFENFLLAYFDALAA